LPKRFDLLTYVKTPSSVDCVFGGFGGWEGFGLVFEEEIRKWQSRNMKPARF
jgi:hypothetical protein